MSGIENLYAVTLAVALVLAARWRRRLSEPTPR
jgi:MYXO-CTERM domain-containing protein